MSVASTAAISSPGIGSGLNVNSIVSQLMSVEQQPLTQLQTQATGYQADLTAWGTVQSGISSLQTAVQALDNPSQFQSLSATVGDTSQLSASINASGAQAVAGSYSLTVNNLAQSQKLISSGFSSTGSVVGSGTLTFEFGTYNSTANTFTPNTSSNAASVTIGSGNDTLQGIVNAVNAANVGVTATVVNDGSANGNHIVFTSNSTGTSNSLRIQVADDDGNNTDTSGLSQLAYDPTAAVGSGQNLSQTQAAADASITIDGIAITSASNTVNNAIQGVTLNLTKADPSSPTTLSVATDDSGISTALNNFVTAYNGLNTTMAQLTAYNSSTSTAGLLLGDPTADALEERLRSVMSQSLPSGALSTLEQVGLGFNSDGSLSLNSTMLNSAVQSNAGDFAGLFSALGSPSDSQISYVSSTAATTAGTYAIYVSQMATNGSAQGSQAAQTTITQGVNDTLNVTVDGVSGTVTLAPGTYTAASLAQQLQTQINGTAAFSSAGVSVVASQSGGVLTLTSQSYGSSSNVNVTGGDGSAALFGTATSTQGVDVAGTINGVPATGSGQFLTGATGTATEGLDLQISGGTTGNRGSVTFTRGFADQLNTLLGGYLGTSGLLTSATDGINTEITNNQTQQTALNAHLATVQATYMAEFTSLDTLISSMQTTSSFLTQQFNAMAGLTPSSNSSGSSSSSGSGG
jgi:flagellar hook-associated protein 2